MPDIPIPEITVQISSANSSARELENTVVRQVRQQLLQVTSLRNIESRSRDGDAVIDLSFEFGTNTDLAFIEVNEKIDAAMSNLPRGIERPRVIKSSAADIPVLCLNLTLRNDEAGIETYLELCDFANNIVRRSIEQLPEVAMVDMTGSMVRQLQIEPDMDLLSAAGITLDDIERSLLANNIDPGSMKVSDGSFRYNLKVSTMLRTEDDIKNIFIRKNERIFQLKDLASVSIDAKKPTGVSLASGRRAVTLAVIKRANESMDDLKLSLSRVIAHLESQNQNVEFSVTRNQTILLDYTISNLRQNLLLGFVLIFFVFILFIGDVKSPLVIALSMVVSIVVSFMFFYLFGRSLNIISLSGLILALGMMIDSGNIVTENITQYRAMGCSLDEACERGTTEVIAPMLSSTFTTIAVFVPLVFISGIAGAIFFDQAFAVTVGLLVSYVVGIMLLPVLYRLVYGLELEKKMADFITPPGSVVRIFRSINDKIRIIDKLYDKGVDFTLSLRLLFLLIALGSLPLCAMLFYIVPKSGMPVMDQVETVVRLEWNENINIEENKRRIIMMGEYINSHGGLNTAYVGEQQFMLTKGSQLSGTEAEVYVSMASNKDIAEMESGLSAWIENNYPLAQFSFSPPETIFEKIFVTSEADVVARISPRNTMVQPSTGEIRQMEENIVRSSGQTPEGVAPKSYRL